MTVDFDHDQFVKDRRVMLLSLDPEQARAFFRTYGSGRRMPDDDQAVLIAMHKARCEAMDIPTAERDASRRWLIARGLKPGLG